MFQCSSDLTMDITYSQCLSEWVGQKGEPGLAVSERGERGPPGRDGDPGSPGNPGKEKITDYSCQHTFSCLKCIWSRWGIQSSTETGSVSVQVIQAYQDSLGSLAYLDPKEILVFLVLVCQDPLVLKVQCFPAIETLIDSCRLSAAMCFPIQ